MYIRRIADIIIHAEFLPAKPVMAAIHIHPAPKHMWLSVGDIFIFGQIGIINLALFIDVHCFVSHLFLLPPIPDILLPKITDFPDAFT